MADSSTFDFGNVADAPVADLAEEVTSAPKAKETKDYEAILKIGQDKLRALGDEEKASLGAGSSSIVFLYMIGNPNKKSKRRAASLRDADGKVRKNENGNVIGEDVDCSEPVGFVFKALVDVTIPQINPELVKAYGAQDVLPDKTVKAGEKFVLTYPELANFASRSEYACKFDAAFCGVDGNIDETKVMTDGAKIVFSLKNWSEAAKATPTNHAGRKVYPRPSVSYNYAGKGAPKAGMRDICTVAEGDAMLASIENGTFFTDALYEEKFKEVFVKKATKAKNAGSAMPRANSGKKLDDSKALCLAVQEILKGIVE